MEIDFKEYIAPLRKWWWMIVVTTFVAASRQLFCHATAGACVPLLHPLGDW